MPPPPIQVYLRTFQLGADPEALHGAAGAVRTLGLRAVAAQQTVNNAADQIASEDAWQGETAENYQGHRSRLTGDLSSLGYEAGHAADLLDEVADLLTWYQAALDNELATLAGIPATESQAQSGPGSPGGVLVTYEPRTEPEVTAVSDAVIRAGDLRNELDATLALKESALRRIIDGYAMPSSLGGSAVGLAELARMWEPRRLRHLNLNIGQGGPTGGGDMAAFAEIINSQDADVVTLQEVFAEDIGKLEEHLDGEWAIYYGHASNKGRGASPENWSESFGNAVLVRQGDGITSSSAEDGDRVGLDVPGSDVDEREADTVSVPADEVPWDEGGHDDGEGRSAAVAEVTIER